jgi:hypothetical protein
MDDLSTLANSPGRGLRIFRGLIADDAADANDVVNVRIPTYDPGRTFGPCPWAPRVLNDGTPLWPMRNDGCLVALDENDQAEILNWWAEDPTLIANRVTQAEHDALAGRVTNLEKFTEPARLDYGPAGQSSNFTSPIEPLHGVTGNPQRFVITPTFNAWLEVAFHAVVVLAGDTGWSRMDSFVSVTPAAPVLTGQLVPPNGWGRDIKYAHVLTGWVGLESRTQIPLTAGVTYTIGASLTPNTGTWAYYRGEFSWIEHGGLKRRS